MKKDDLFIGMLCSCSKGTGVISWIDDKARHVYVANLACQSTQTGEHYKVKIDEIDFWLDPTTIKNK